MMSAKFPDFVETDLNIINALSFRLPATAVGIDSNKIMEIVVEYGENPTNTSDLIANAWAVDLSLPSTCQSKKMNRLWSRLIESLLR